VLFGISFILRSSGLSIPEPIRRKRLRNAIYLLTAVSTIVRLEIALFLLPVVLSLVIQRRISLSNALLYGVVGGVGSLGMSTRVGLSLTTQSYQHQSTSISGYQPSPTPHFPSTPGNNSYGPNSQAWYSTYTMIKLPIGVLCQSITTLPIHYPNYCAGQPYR
jgi:hypothetical protein